MEHQRGPRGPAKRSGPAHWPCELSPTLPCRPRPLRRPPWARARTSVTPAEGTSHLLWRSPAGPTPHPRATTAPGVAPRAMLAEPASPAHWPALRRRAARLAAPTRHAAAGWTPMSIGWRSLLLDVAACSGSCGQSRRWVISSELSARVRGRCRAVSSRAAAGAAMQSCPRARATQPHAGRTSAPSGDARVCCTRPRRARRPSQQPSSCHGAPPATPPHRLAVSSCGMPSAAQQASGRLVGSAAPWRRWCRPRRTLPPPRRRCSTSGGRLAAHAELAQKLARIRRLWCARPGIRR